MTLQERCELGQRLLMSMDYLAAADTLAEAERLAWSARDFDTLSRLLLPLQESRRQIRQRCGEGVVCLDLIASGPHHLLDPEKIVHAIPHGQLLVAAWKTIEPALRIRHLQSTRRLYLETFLATSDGRIHILPFPGAADHCITLEPRDLLPGRHTGTAQTYGLVMSIWERLHSPYLAAAAAQSDPIQKMAAYRLAIEVDYACEPAHQAYADAARNLASDLASK